MACGTARTIEANGLRLRLYEWGGDGPLALLLHSLAAHSHWWDWTAPLLAERFTVAALDLRGHGESDRPEPPSYRGEDYVRDVAAVLDELGWRSPLVVGHSLGGWIGAYLAATEPQRVGLLVMADVRMQASERELEWQREQSSRPGREFASREEAADRFKLAPPETVAPAERLRHLGERGVRETGPGVWQHAFDRQVFADAPAEGWSFLPRVASPTLVIRGAGSPIMDAEAAARAAATVQHGELAQLEGAFHHLIVDDPERFAAAVASWY